MWISTPALRAALSVWTQPFNQDMLPQLKWPLLAGEALLPSLVSQLYDRFPRAEVWNGYGPTETTILTSSQSIDRDMLTRDIPPCRSVSQRRARASSCSTAKGITINPETQGEGILVGGAKR